VDLVAVASILCLLTVAGSLAAGLILGIALDYKINVHCTLLWIVDCSAFELELRTRGESQRGWMTLRWLLAVLELGGGGGGGGGAPAAAPAPGAMGGRAEYAGVHGGHQERP
jgi:hypothetical protein